MGYETSGPRILPREEIRPAWRAAVLAYRRQYRVNPDDCLARTAAFEAFCRVLLDMPEEQAKVETNHAKWFWGRGDE